MKKNNYIGNFNLLHPSSIIEKYIKYKIQLQS